MTATRKSNSFRLRAVGFALVVALAIGGALLLAGPETLAAIVGDAWERLQTMPAWLYFPVMAIVCILPVPISPFYVAAGPLFGTTTALLWIGIAVAFNQIAAYALAAGVARPVIESQLRRRGYSIPTIREAHDQNLFAFLVRAVPGLPYAIQNWTLGLAGIDRGRYLVISWPIQMIYATAWVVAGESAFEGRYGRMLVAVGVIVLVALAGRWVGVRARRNRAAGLQEEDAPARAE